MPHTAVRLRGEHLDIFWSRYGDTPEHILVSEVRLMGHWTSWHSGDTHDVILPERPWEGADLPLAPSRIGSNFDRVRELRDPCIFEEESQTYLLYSIAGEQGLGIAELFD